MMSHHFFLALGLAVFGLVGRSLSAEVPAEMSGQVIYLDGDVTANDRIVETGDVLTGEVTFQTGTDSVLEVTFGGKNILRLGSHTVAKVDFNTAAKTFELHEGTLTAVLKQLGQLLGTVPFQVITPTVNAGVRGTSFFVSAEGTSTYFCVCNGTVELADSTGGPGEPVSAAHHSSRVFTQGENGRITVTEGGLEGHTDADISALARKIGVTVDWTKAD